MSTKEKIIIAAVLICTALIIIIPAVLSMKNNSGKKTDDELGDVVMTENLGLSDADVQDSEFEVTDGPTGGDEPDLFNFQFTNADKLIEKGVTFGLYNHLYESFSRFQSANEKYRDEAYYAIDYDTYADNDSQTYFEFVSERYPDTVFQLVYNKTDHSINITVK